MLRLTPRKRQTLLFSATLTDEVRDLIRLSLVRPVRLAADAAGAAPKKLVQEVVRFKGGGAAGGAAGREATLLALCSRSFRCAPPDISLTRGLSNCTACCAPHG